MATLAAQLLLNALALGSAYALVALGFVLVINAAGAVNFAHGDLVMAGGFTSIALASIVPASGLALLPLVLVAMAALGLLFSAIAYFPLARRPPVAVFISTIAVGIMLQNGANVLFGAAPRAGPPIAGAGTFGLGGLHLDRQSIAIILAAAFLIVLCHVVLARTRTGRRLRAAAEDPELARLAGIPVRRMVAITFALAAALAGAAGLLLSNQYFVTPNEGTALMFKAYVAVVIGGWGRLGGALAGALLIALFEVVVAAVLSQPVAEGLLYAALLAILLMRPQGLFGEALGRRA